MAKKVTIRDVAKLAGVSVATVSYVLNQKKGQKISEATKRKVLQISNLLGYMHSSLVKSLINQRSNNVALFYTASANIFKRSLDQQFFEKLSNSLHRIGKDLMVIPNVVKTTVAFSDAILAYDVVPEFFRAIGNANFVPLIGVNIVFNDPLFFQINPSMSRAESTAKSAFGESDFDFLYLPATDKAVDDKLKARFPQARPIEGFKNLMDYLGEKSEKPVLCYGEDLYEAVKSAGRKAALFDPFGPEILEKINEALVKTIAKSDAGNKSFEL